jgi:hypothetical protein
MASLTFIHCFLTQKGLLTKLETLHLRQNKLGGTLPCSMKQMTALKRLTLNDNLDLSGYSTPLTCCVEIEVDLATILHFPMLQTAKVIYPVLQHYSPSGKSTWKILPSVFRTNG